MKNLILVFALAVTSVNSYARSCNLKTETKFTRGGSYVAGYWKKSETNIPRGNCDELGAIADRGDVALCKQVALEEGYDCFQIESVETSFYSFVTGKQVSNETVCFACIE